VQRYRRDPQSRKDLGLVTAQGQYVEGPQEKGVPGLIYKLVVAELPAGPLTRRTTVMLLLSVGPLS
jgi:hypothetical protein